MSTEEPEMLIMTLFFGMLGTMFLCLAKTPKGSTYLFGKEKGIKVSAFVWICIIVAFLSFGILVNAVENASLASLPITAISSINQLVG